MNAENKKIIFGPGRFTRTRTDTVNLSLHYFLEEMMHLRNKDRMLTMDFPFLFIINIE